jgi:hypothetical protein
VGTGAGLGQEGNLLAWAEEGSQVVVGTLGDP